MGNNVNKSTKLEVSENILHLTEMQSKCQDMRLPLSRALQVHLVPQFATTDTPGRSVQYKLQLTLCSNSQHSGEELDASVSTASNSDDGENGLLCVIVQFTETVTREQRKSVAGFARRTSVIKYNTWIGKTGNTSIDNKRLRLKGQVKQANVNDSESATLDLDLILCPSDLIIPETEKEWLLIGTLYLRNLKERKDFKWRAAVAKDVIM